MASVSIVVCVYCFVCVVLIMYGYCFFFFFQAEDGIRDQPRSRGLGDVYKRQDYKGIGSICPRQGREKTCAAPVTL